MVVVLESLVVDILHQQHQHQVDTVVCHLLDMVNIR
jgi:hypothetical protein